MHASEMVEIQFFITWPPLGCPLGPPPGRPWAAPGSPWAGLWSHFGCCVALFGYMCSLLLTLVPFYLVFDSFFDRFRVSWTCQTPPLSQMTPKIAQIHPDRSLDIPSGEVSDRDGSAQGAEGVFLTQSSPFPQPHSYPPPSSFEFALLGLRSSSPHQAAEHDITISRYP